MPIHWLNSWSHTPMASPSLLTPPPVPVELYVTNRQKLLKSFRQHLSDSARPLQGIVLLQVNKPLFNSLLYFVLSSCSFVDWFLLLSFLHFFDCVEILGRWWTDALRYGPSRTLQVLRIPCCNHLILGSVTWNSTSIAHSFCFWFIGWFCLQARELFCLSVWSHRAWILWCYCKLINSCNGLIFVLCIIEIHFYMEVGLIVEIFW